MTGRAYILAAVAGVLLLILVGQKAMEATSGDSVLEALRKAAERWKVPPRWMEAIARAESNLNPSAVNNSGSDAARGGAWGLMQITLKTAQSYGYSGTGPGLLDLATNADWAGRILAASNAVDLKDAATWWNAGKRHFADLSEAHPTRKYVARVMALLPDLELA